MELPEELLQLKDFQKQRREAAAKEYRVNAQGLLIRTGLHPKKPGGRPPGKEDQIKGFLFCKASDIDKAPRFLRHGSDKDENFLDKECKQTTAKSHNLPPRKEAKASEESENKPKSRELAGPEDPRTQRTHSLTPTHESQAHFSLKEEIEQLLMVKNKEAVRSPNEDTLVTPSLPQETWVAPSDTFHLSGKAVMSTLPPCPALEKTDPWISPSPNLF